ncbi:uncharacterized protein LOC119676538 [Teleopsis dalmanni]|uniref:uncharacterized protein LOC119676538 n=1 Tax=Teleopsis dalmanni TaxID=139649 RepID=UPI0018CD9D28|nr:uncharacterized protein LOC119676538 [Teleopsis dalmanni]
MDSLNKLNKQKTNKELGTSSEDELLASSQENERVETAILPKVGSSSRTAPTSHITVKSADKRASHSAPAEKSKKSEAKIRRQRYQKAMFILGKIAKNEAEGKEQTFDRTDKVRYQKVVDEYNEYQATLSKPAKAMKRDRSQDETAHTSKSKVARTSYTSKPSTSAKRAYNEVARDELQVALIDDITGNGKKVLEKWGEIEPKLAGMVMEHLLTNLDAPTPGFDSSEVVRGCRVFKCDDQLSKVFLGNCIAKVSDTWEGLRLKLIPANDIPRRPRARIWLPIMKMEHEKVLQLLQRQNQNVPMNDWVVIKDEGTQKNNMTLLLAINEESVKPLEEMDCKLRFGVRYTKIKIFRPTGNDDDGKELEDANKMLDGMKLQEEASETS